MAIDGTLFKKISIRKWIWQSINENTKNEIDFIPSIKINTVKNVNVQNKLRTGSDHRMIKSKIILNTKLEKD